MAVRMEDNRWNSMRLDQRRGTSLRKDEHSTVMTLEMMQSIWRHNMKNETHRTTNAKKFVWNDGSSARNNDVCCDTKAQN